MSNYAEMRHTHTFYLSEPKLATLFVVEGHIWAACMKARVWVVTQRSWLQINSFILLVGTEGLSSHGHIIGVLGEDLVLPCYLKPSTTAEVKEVFWLIGDNIVHHYGTRPLSQLPEYEGRTSLNITKLKRENLSLKLTVAKLSDTNTYKCLIITQTGTQESSVSVTVEGRYLIFHIYLICGIYFSLKIYC